MTFYSEVNTRLRDGGYRAFMARQKKPGSAKGSPKPIKRYLDPKFPDRLLSAMLNKRKGYTNADLARDAGCERATIGNYLSGKQKLIEAFLLFAIADALTVDPRWLLFGPVVTPPSKTKRERETTTA